MGPSLAVFLASVGLTSAVARTLATAGAAPSAKLSSRVLTLSGAALLTLAGCVGAKCSVQNPNPDPNPDPDPKPNPDPNPNPNPN